jgi:hypothetical protein
MYIDNDQKIELERLQKNFKIPMAEIIRKAISRFLSEYKKKKQFSNDETVEKLILLAGICNGGPRDLADNHDKYLYGITKS